MRFLLLLLVLTFVTSCGLSHLMDHSPKVTIEGGSQPVFKFHGSGYLGSFILIDTSLKSPNTWIWEIAHQGGPENAKPLEEIKSIQYGVVPSGYKQELPARNVHPPSLTEGKHYLYIVGTINASIATGGFEIKNGKAISSDHN